LYSIASSLKAVEDEAHLTVAVVGYEAFGLHHAGAASHFLRIAPWMAACRSLLKRTSAPPATGQLA